MSPEPHTDISNAEDVARMVREFYSRVYRDDVLRPMFADVARLDLEEHLPKMNRFWGTVLLGQQSYHGSPMKAHHALNALQPLHECHHLRWIALFCQTVDSLFRGPRAEQAKEVARRVNQAIELSLARARGADRSGTLREILV